MKKVLLILLSIAVMVPLLQISFGWFSSAHSVTEDRLAGSSLANYFKSGNGSEDTPYIITTPRHLYNLIWLQNVGRFEDNPCFFQIGDENNPTPVLDMKGTFPNPDGETGAVPPIGTYDRPFQGYFNGNGCIIRNLWVSSDPEDWEEGPVSYEGGDFSYGVGFFGYISRPENDDTTPVYAGNFMLENIEVTTHLSDATVGLAAGYVDAAMSRIGVENGIITAKAGCTVESDYVLVGKTSDETSWTDSPGSDGGGDLVIAPSGLKREPEGSVIYPVFANVGANTIAPVQPAITVGGRVMAYYVGGTGAATGTLQQHTLSPDPNNKSNYYKYTGGTVSFSGAQTMVNINNSTATNLTASSTALADEAFLNYCFNGAQYRDQTASYSILPSEQPSFSGVTDDDSYPTGCIWFKPQNAGTCYVAFARENNNAAKYMSIYRFRRDSNGAMMSGSLQEIIFSFDNKQLSNGVAVLFELEITDSDLENEYEYAIGKRSGTYTNQSKDDASFFFLKLAGVDSQGGNAEGGTSRILEKLEFIHDSSAPPNFDAEDYRPGRSKLNITGTADNTAGTVLRFHEFVEGRVHYTSYPATLNVAEALTTPESIPDNTGPYPDRAKK